MPPGMHDKSARVAIIAPMPNELRPVVKMLGLRRTGEQGGLPVYSGAAGTAQVVATRTGIGPRLATEATQRLLSSTSVDRVIVTGIAGGIEPVSAVGDLVVPEEVVDGATGERFRAAPVAGVALKGVIRTGDVDDYSLADDEIATLRDQGVIALDMETAAIARVCQEHNTPWIAFRAISDMAGDETIGPVVMTLVNPDGSPKLGASLRFLLTHPRRIPRMMRLAREANAAAVAAAKAAVRTIESA
jgi:adenosylhomocysteine nucleosidase